MRIRLCNKCKQEIPKNEPYIICQKISRKKEAKHLFEYLRLGDLCLSCWENKLK